MDHRIALITSSTLIAQRTGKVFQQLGCAYPLAQVPFEQTLSSAARAIEDGARVFISRGRSAQLLKQFDLPIVSLRFTYFDFATAIATARRHCERIAIVGYHDSWFHAVEPYRELLSNALTVYIDSPDELDATMQRLCDDGVGAVIGGATASRVAQAYGLDAVHVGIEDSSIIDSIEEARYLLQIELQRSTHIATINTILNNASEGMVSVSTDRIITSANSSAKRILGEECIGTDISHHIDNKELLQVEKGISRNRELSKINRVLCTVNVSSIKDETGVSGGVFTFQPVQQVQSLEQTIRKKQADSGNVAKNQFSDIIGQSQAMCTTIETAKRFACSNSTVLIFGETGTGKEMFAQSIHNASRRASGPFVAINCAALPQNVLESELFGYVKGAFTGANPEGKAGYFEMAHTGTIFLDEIGEMPLEMQIKLLRVLQEREVRRIGDHKVFRVDTRVIAASNRDLLKLVNEGRFREDLYYRLAVLELRIPPLRQRTDDIALLAAHMLQDIAARESQPCKTISKGAQSFLDSLDWLGNVRQIRNVMERAFVMCDTAVISESLLHNVVHISPDDTKPKTSTRKKAVSDLEKKAIVEALRQERGNRERTAQRLGISKATLWRRMSEIEQADPGYIAGLLSRY